MIEEMKGIYKTQGNIELKAYYKIINGLKVYYDFQELTESRLNGSYDVLEMSELLYYIEEQNRGMFY